MRFRHYCALLIGASLISFSSQAVFPTQVSTFQKTDCAISIVGASMAGALLAYRLAPEYGDSLCIFEKEAHVGGRLYDEPIDGFGYASHGGRRIMETQSQLMSLAKELNIPINTPETGANLIFTLGMFGTSSDEFSKRYRNL